MKLTKKRIRLLFLTFVLLLFVTALIPQEIFKRGSFHFCAFNKCSHPHPEKEEMEAIDRITRIVDAVDSKNAQIAFWNHFSLKNTPIIVTFDHDHLFLLNPPPEVLFQRIGGIIRINTANVLYIDHDPWNVKNVQMHQHFPFYGKEAYVFRFEKSLEDPIFPFLNFVRERFHYYQEKNFKNYSVPKDAYLDLFQVENIAMMQVEEMLLSEGLRALHDPNFLRENQIKLWQEIIAVIKARRQFLAPSSVVWEDRQQRINGLADYVSMRVLFSLDSRFNFQPFHRLIESFHRSRIDEEILEYIVKWRHYAVGSLLAMTLDHFEVSHWKNRVEQGASPFELLEEYLGSETVVASRVEELKEEHNYNQWLNQAQEAIEGYRQDLEELEQDYSASKGVIFHVEVPKEMPITESGVSLYTYYMPDGRMIKIADNSQATNDDWRWSFQAMSLPILFRSPSGAYEFKMDVKCHLKLDDRDYSIVKLLKCEREMPFETIAWKCSSNKFKANLPGKLLIKSNSIIIQFN